MRRTNHLARKHKGEDKTAFNRIRAQPAEAAVGPIPLRQQAWTCAKCQGGLPCMDKQVLRKFALQHLAKCSKLSMMQNRKKVAASGLLRERHADATHHLVKERAAVFNKRRQKLEKKTGHRLCMVNARYGNSATVITCTTCTSVFEAIGSVTRGKCRGRSLRKSLLRLKRALMTNIQDKDSAGLKRLWTAWELNSDERTFAANLIAKQQE